MHRKLSQWLSEYPAPAGVMAACLGVMSLQGAVLFVVLASAVIMLLSLQRTVAVAARTTMLAVVVVTSLLTALKLPLVFSLSYGIAVFVVPFALAQLLRRTGSMNLVFQLTVVVGCIALALVYLLNPHPAAVWERLMGNAMQVLAQSGVQMDATLVPELARKMWGAFAAMALLSLFGALCLARWWQSLLVQPGAFGREFRELRTGVVLGGLLVVVVVTALMLQADWLDNLSWLAVAALALQGLATVHRYKAEGRLQRGWLIATYVLLIVPVFSFVTVVLLAGMGLADFWRRMRLDAMRA